MAWAIATAIAALLLYRFFSEPSRKVKARCFAALRARNRKNWKFAAQFYCEAHEIARRLKEPLRSKMESQVEVQWANVLYRQGQLHAAEDMVRRGLLKGEPHFAPESEMLLQAHLWWGDLCMDEGRHHEAEEHYRKALEGDESTDNLAGMIFDLQRLSDSLIRQGRRAEAEPVINRGIALEIRSARDYAANRGMNPDEYRLTATSLPDLHFCREEYEDARRLYRAQVEHWKAQVKRPDNIDLGRLQMRVALTEEKLGHLEEAINAHESAADEFEQEWCEGHLKAISARKAKAALEMAAGR
jgi:tetratricopeptide (TPR) repeat protein